MDCIVVDDSKLARTALIHIISQIELLNLKAEFENPLEAFNYLQKTSADLIFLDVEMPGMTGLEFLSNLKNHPIVILITSKRDYAVDAFELNVADYIVKPVLLPRLLLAVGKAKELFEAKDNKNIEQDSEKKYIFIRNKTVLQKIDILDILYIQALGDYVNIHTEKEKYTIHLTLKSIEEKLHSDFFYRLHRSYIVALDKINSIEEGTAYVKNTAIPIGEQYKQTLLEKLNYI